MGKDRTEGLASMTGYIMKMVPGTQTGKLGVKALSLGKTMNLKQLLRNWECKQEL